MSRASSNRAVGSYHARMLRIIAGEFRSRSLLGPDDASVSRPYGSRVKESIFNLLRGWFEDATVIDLFAGVGTMGLEAVSRGAARVFMVERDRDVYNLLRQNIERLGCGDRATAVNADALGPLALQQAPRPADLIFVDPPYELMSDETSRRRVQEQVARCRALMCDKGFVILRGPVGPEDADLSITGFVGPEVHRYGGEMFVLLYAPALSSDRTDPGR
jgi:16S rRNA (guanine966-N2)-methyltransferase